MNILHLTKTYMPWGGIEQYILAAAGLLEKHGYRSLIAYWEDHPDTIKNGNFPKFYLPSNRGAGKDDLLQELERLIRDERVDVVYLHLADSAQMIEAVSRMAPTVGYIHGFVPTCPGLAKLYRRGDAACKRPFGLGCAPMIYLKRCSEARDPRTVISLMNTTRSIKQAYKSLDCILVASTAMRDLLAQNGFDSNRIRIIPPHFETPHPVSAPQKDPPVVLFAGRLEIEKGFPYLLKAMARVQAPYQLVVSGDGTQRVIYEALSRQLGLTEQVIFLGWKDQSTLHRLYERASLLVFPSIYPEPFGKVGVEAMAHARPVVSFELGGIPDWLKDGYNGYLVPARDIDRLAERIQALLTNEDLARKLGLNGQKCVEELFSPQRHLTQLVSAFDSISDVSQRNYPNL